jgi:hypothetical protein
MSTELNAAPRTGLDWSRAVRLSPVEFLACWTALRLGDPPLALDLRPSGTTLAEHRQIHEAALAGLAGRGLVDRSGPVVPLAGALRLLATAPYLYDLRLTGATGPDNPADWPAELVAVGAAAREYGVVAVLGGGELALLPVPGPRVPPALVELIGPLTPARARPVNVPAELLDLVCRGVPDGDLWALADRLVEYGVLPADANALARMCTGITAAGQLGATAQLGHTAQAGHTARAGAPTQGSNGGQRRGRWVVGFHRGQAGDCLQLRRPTNTQGVTVTIAPITAQKLLTQLADLLADLDRPG